MSRNQDFAFLHYDLPPDIARRKAAGDLKGAIRLIDIALGKAQQPELAARLRCERIRLERLPQNYPYSQDEAKAMMRQEWPDMTDAQFQHLLDAGRIDWRIINGRLYVHDDFIDSSRMYPEDAPGLKPEAEDTTARDQMLARMEAEGGLAARITIKAEIQPKEAADGRRVQAWLPIPAACPQQSEIELLDYTEGAQIAPEDAPQRTIYWDSRERDHFSVTYRYLIRAPFVNVHRIVPDKVQPSFFLNEEAPHIMFTPYLRDLCARITKGFEGPLEKAVAIYDYVTGQVDYRYQPDYFQLDSIADTCARELRGDCGVMAILFITLCRIAGIPAKWQSGLSVKPGEAGCHDWAMFYIAPHGWLWADPSFGSGARRHGDNRRRAHYFGNLDPNRMVANRAFFAPLTPPDPEWRHDPTDNQMGEMVLDGKGLFGPDMVRKVETLEFEYLPY